MQQAAALKKPSKSILKTSISFNSPARKSARFDELNVIQTYHPLDKDYGNMKIGELKTPFNYIDQGNDQNEELDADLLAEKLRVAAQTQTPSFGIEDISDDEFPENEVEKVRRLEFERRRKAHYNEFEAVRLARKLIEEEMQEDDDEDELTADDEDKPVIVSEHLGSEENTPREEVNFEDQSQATNVSSADTAPDVPADSNSDIDVDQYAPGHPCAGRR